MEGGRLHYLARCCCSGWANICNWYLPFCENEPICVCSVVAPKTPMLLLAPLFIVMPMALRRVAVRAIERGTCATLQSRFYEKQTNERRKSTLVLVKTDCEKSNLEMVMMEVMILRMMSEKQWKINIRPYGWHHFNNYAMYSRCVRVSRCWVWVEAVIIKSNSLFAHK